MSDDCGCCATPPGETAIENRPGLPAIAYRPGTFATFRQQIVQALAHAHGLERLTARGPDDYTITAIELWSAVADILAFYQERTANEAFIRTAIVRDSVLRLVRLIGYELAPGVSAQTWLAFMLERSHTALIPARTRVKSVPVRNEAPAIFETMAPVEADAGWNALEPFRLVEHEVKAGDRGADFAGVTTRLAPGDLLVFIGKRKRRKAKSTEWDVVRVQTVKADPKTQRTHVTWLPTLGSKAARPFPRQAHVYALRQRASVFGHNAPDWHMIADAGKAQFLGLPAPGDVTEEDRREWPQFEIYGPVYPNAPRQKRSPGLLTIHPTEQSVADAANAAAASAKEVVVADAARAATDAVNAVGKVTAVGNKTSAELAKSVIANAGTQAGVAIAEFAGATGALNQVTLLATGLSGALFQFFASITAFPPGLPFFAADLTGAATTVANGITAAAADVVHDEIVAAAKAMTDLLGTFTKVANDTAVSTGLGDLVGAADDAVRDINEGVEQAARPLGAIAVEKAVKAAVQWALDNNDDLATLSPSQASEAERVGFVAMVVAKFVQTAINDAGVKTSVTGGTIPDQAKIGTIWRDAVAAAKTAVVATAAASAATLALVAPVAPLGATAVGAAAALWPVMFAGATAAILVGAAASPGAERVADAVCRAVVAALEDSHPLAPERYVGRTLTANYVDLDTVYPRLVSDSWLLLSSPVRDELYHVTRVQQTSRTDFSLTGAVTRVKLEGNALAPDSKGHNPYFNIRETAVFAGSEELALALDTSATPFTGDTIDVVGMPNHVPAGRDLLVVGTDAATGQPASDLVTLKEATLAPARGTGAVHAFVTFKEPVSRQYSLDGLVVYGNVAYATHGETIRNEILGDGDASRDFQKFALKKKPVTYAPDETSGALGSSLTVTVNGVRWIEAPTLYGASPDDPIYTARIANDGTLTVRFGDGVTGSRLPSGRQNVVAQYRQGIGAAGRLVAGRLTTPLDRPAGLRAATNPVPAVGGVEPESLESARVTAPGTVRTFGRAVSLKDFEDSTLTDGLVAKASATWVWTGERRAIFVTVGLVGGDVLSEPTKTRLMAKLDSERDTNHRLIIAEYTRVPILIAARIIVRDRYVAATVLAAARAALLATLSFEARGFGQPVYLSDVYATLQNVDGVEYVDVDTLDLKSRDVAVRAAHRIDDSLGQPQPRLLMLAARQDHASGDVLPAELAVVEADDDVTLSSLGGVSE